jgi:hypothetical protein
VLGYWFCHLLRFCDWILELFRHCGFFCFSFYYKRLRYLPVWASLVLIICVRDSSLLTKNNKDCTSKTDDFLIWTHQNVILLGSPTRWCLISCILYTHTNFNKKVRFCFMYMHIFYCFNKNIFINYLLFSKRYKKPPRSQSFVVGFTSTCAIS